MKLLRQCLVLNGILLTFSLIAFGQALYQAEKDIHQTEEIPYQRYFTRDSFSRRITFYVTKPNAAPEAKLPLIVSILGSGGDSNFLRRGGRILDGHRVLRSVFSGLAYILIVEKPGIALGEHPALGVGFSEGTSEEFRRENTLERWSEAVSAALRAGRTLPFIDTGRTLVLGHSEGGLVACRVAAMNSFVTHVASLAGGGPSILFDIVELTREGYMGIDTGGTPDERVQKLLSDWAEIMRDADNPSRYLYGQTYRWWSSEAADSCMEELLKTRARVYIAQGTEDHKVPPITFDILLAHLLAHGRDVTGDRVIGAVHSLMFPNEPDRDGQLEVFERIRKWFFGQN